MKRLIVQKERLWRQLAQCGNFVRGSINCVCGKCNRANCICKKKSSARAYRLTYKDRRQRTRIVYITKDKLPEIKQLLAQYSQARKLIEQIIATNIEIFKKGGITDT